MIDVEAETARIINALITRRENEIVAILGEDVAATIRSEIAKRGDVGALIERFNLHAQLERIKRLPPIEELLGTLRLMADRAEF